MNLAKKQNINHQLVLCLFIGAIFFLDILNKFDFAEETPWLPIIKFIKSVFYVFFLGVVLKQFQENYLKIGLIILALFFVLGQFFLFTNGVISEKDWIPTFRYLILLFFPLIFSGYILLFPHNQPNKILKTVFHGIIFLMIISIFIGFIWEIKLFKTYVNRFGYLGLMPKSITATYFSISALSLLYYSYIIQKETQLKWLFIGVLISSFLVGTKAVYLFILLLLGYHFIRFKWYKKTFLYITSALIFVSLYLFKDIFYTQGKLYFKDMFLLYETKGLLASLTSLRDEILITNFNNYKEVWQWFNYLIGGKVYSFMLYENSVLDLYSFFGILGLGIYLWIFYKNLGKMISARNSFSWFFLIAVFIISILAGQFFLNISAVFYFILSFYLINSYDEK
jgi:hypothetical protein